MLNYHLIRTIDLPSAVFGLCADLLNNQFYAGSGRQVFRCSFDEDEPIGLIARTPSTIFSLNQLNDYLLIGTQHHGAFLLDLSLKKNVVSGFPSSGSIFDFAFWKDQIFLARSEGILEAFMMNDFKKSTSLQLSSQHLRSFCFFQDHLCIGSSDNHIFMLNEELQTVKILKGHANSVFTIAANHKVLVSGSRDAQLRRWQPFSDQIFLPINAHLYTINKIAFNKKLKIWATASRDRSIKIWSEDFRLLKVIDNTKTNFHTHSVNNLFWMEKNHQLITVGDDRKVMIWQIEMKKNDTNG